MAQQLNLSAGNPSFYNPKMHFSLFTIVTLSLASFISGTKLVWDVPQFSSHFISSCFQKSPTLVTFDLDKVTHRSTFSGGPREPLTHYYGVISRLSQISGVDIHIISEGSLDDELRIFQNILDVTLVGKNGRFIRPRSIEGFVLRSAPNSGFHESLVKLGEQQDFNPRIHDDGATVEFTYHGSYDKIKKLAKKYDYSFTQGPNGCVELNYQFTRGEYVKSIIETRKYKTGISFGDESPDEGIHKVINKKRYFSVALPSHHAQETCANYMVPDDAHLLRLFGDVLG